MAVPMTTYFLKDFLETSSFGSLKELVEGKALDFIFDLKKKFRHFHMKY
jgi:hypothetical protein